MSDGMHWAGEGRGRDEAKGRTGSRNHTPDVVQFGSAGKEYWG